MALRWLRASLSTLWPRRLTGIPWPRLPRFARHASVSTPGDEKLEEETWPFYSPELFYPVRIGEVFQARYQVLGKLGYGGHSTVWMCRNIR